MDQRLSIITLGVKHLDQSKAFYNALGWTPVNNSSDENIVAYNLNNMTLALYPIDKLYEDVGQEPPKINRPSFSLAYNVHQESDVDLTLKEAEKAGGKIIKPAQKVFWGGYSGYFSDPNNYLWEVAFNPFSSLGNNGSFQWSESP